MHSDNLSNMVPDNPYFLLTPGPLSTSKQVRASLLFDMCTWDEDFTNLTQKVRAELCSLLGAEAGEYTCVLMQGSGTFSVEAVIGSAVPKNGKLLIVANGHYGRRMAKIAEYLDINHILLDFGEDSPVDMAKYIGALRNDPFISHVAAVHVETSTGILNPVKKIGGIAKKMGKVFILDAMSSFGGLDEDFSRSGADFIIASSNKCVQGIPGIGFILARRELMEQTKGYARSLSLDLYSQWKEMEEKHGKWRYTAPTHALRALDTALAELEAEGGPKGRHARYAANQKKLVMGMRELGFAALLPDEHHSPIITTFHYHDNPGFTFEKLYNGLKKKGFIIYPGKITFANTFRLGNIGEISSEDISFLLEAVKDVLARIHE